MAGPSRPLFMLEIQIREKTVKKGDLVEFIYNDGRKAPGYFIGIKTVSGSKPKDLGELVADDDESEEPEQPKEPVKSVTYASFVTEYPIGKFHRGFEVILPKEELNPQGIVQYILPYEKEQ